MGQSKSTSHSSSNKLFKIIDIFLCIRRIMFLYMYNWLHVPTETWNSWWIAVTCSSLRLLTRHHLIASLRTLDSRWLRYSWCFLQKHQQQHRLHEMQQKHRRHIYSNTFSWRSSGWRLLAEDPVMPAGGKGAHCLLCGGARDKRAPLTCCRIECVT